jgi:hypothetical protein
MEDCEKTNVEERERFEEEHVEAQYVCATFVITLDEDGEHPRDHGASRGEKYERRRAHAREMRDAVMDWLERQGISHEDVSDVGEPTVFGTFTVETTPRVARLIERAPHVAHVIPADDAPLDLLRA